jgi:Ca-activated chloride channel homolog
LCSKINFCIAISISYRSRLTYLLTFSIQFFTPEIAMTQSFQPQIELIPLHPVVCSDRPSTLDVIVRITPPARPVNPKRPPLNLGFVLDRSGSMHGDKISYARQAIVYAVQQLQTSDRLSVTIFDDQVETVIPSTPAIAKTQLIQTINQIHPGGSTALHAGWVQGGIQVSQHLRAEAMNRVILLSDGLANVGETNADVISSQVHGLVKRGVSTSTLGVGHDYDEDLLEAIARSGDGNYYYIASPTDLPTIFETELQGLVATVGHTVSLGIEPQAGVQRLDVFNDFDRNSYGRYQLPNLVQGNTLEVALRLKVPPMEGQGDLCFFRLAWNDPDQGDRQVMRVQLRLPAVPFATLSEFTPNPGVQSLIAQLLVARAKEEAADYTAQGDIVGTRAALSRARAAAPMMLAERAAAELTALDELEADLDKGSNAIARKKMLFQRYQTRQQRTKAL